MSISEEINGLDDLILKADLVKIFDDVERIADTLEAIWRHLDDTAYRMALPGDRAAMSRIARVAADAALAMRRPGRFPAPGPGDAG